MNPLNWLSEAYVVHLTSIHRRPVYRHENGDIALSCHAIAAFVDGYFGERYSQEKRSAMYARLVVTDDFDSKGYFVCLGTPPRLKPRGIRLVNAMLQRFGLMVEFQRSLPVEV